MIKSLSNSINCISQVFDASYILLKLYLNHYMKLCFIICIIDTYMFFEINFNFSIWFSKHLLHAPISKQFIYKRKYRNLSYFYFKFWISCRLYKSVYKITLFYKLRKLHWIASFSSLSHPLLSSHTVPSPPSPSLPYPLSPFALQLLPVISSQNSNLSES